MFNIRVGSLALCQIYLLLDAFWHTRPCSLVQQNRYLKMMDWMPNTLLWDWNQPHPLKKEEGSMELLFFKLSKDFSRDVRLS